MHFSQGHCFGGTVPNVTQAFIPSELNDHKEYTPSQTCHTQAEPKLSGFAPKTYAFDSHKSIPKMEYGSALLSTQISISSFKPQQP